MTVPQLLLTVGSGLFSEGGILNPAGQDKTPKDSQTNTNAYILPLTIVGLGLGVVTLIIALTKKK